MLVADFGRTLCNCQNRNQWKRHAAAKTQPVPTQAPNYYRRITTHITAFRHSTTPGEGLSCACSHTALDSPHNSAPNLALSLTQAHALLPTTELLPTPIQAPSTPSLLPVSRAFLAAAPSRPGVPPLAPPAAAALRFRAPPPPPPRALPASKSRALTRRAAAALLLLRPNLSCSGGQRAEGGAGGGQSGTKEKEVEKACGVLQGLVATKYSRQPRL